ncbi:oligosaccharide flippase family protein [Terricaulis silvestris]|uniref:Lipopolysaccharide biosynthesis protein WzxC n=1 Tax=Terricaulis silvestris TaxID=2686094 RepID=A0A6I6MQG0_9CAUL|nr:oligosaccharide flippase family protein [Terricaulis silvestris]QGZ93403.1 Lipopolysaccharide biosynthesis protein WzxC [Terricaulis silvestris]
MLARDIIQFLTMLVMVRLLSPLTYGQAALAQTILGFVAIASLKTLAQYPLQAREPEEFDWDAHFTAGAALNFVAFALTNLVGMVILFFGDGNAATVGGVLILLSFIFILEIACTYHMSWLQAYHRWRRLRILLFVGAFMSGMAGVVLALMGWGVFALASMGHFFALPLVVDFFMLGERRPNFALSRLRDYAHGVSFGINRAVSGLVTNGRALAEHAALSGAFGFAALGTFSRAIGLASISSGRIGPVVAQTLYPVLTRAEASSERFQRFSALLLQGVVWVSLPAAAFLAYEARAVVQLLYGARWESVIPFLPMASALLAIRGVSATLNQIMLANLQTRDCLSIDVATASLAIAAIPIALPFGVAAYLATLTGCEALALCASIYLAQRGQATAVSALIAIAAPCLAATSIACLLLAVLPSQSSAQASAWYFAALGLVGHGVMFAATYLFVLRLCAPSATAAMLDALPLDAGARNVVARLFPRRSVG